MINILLTGAGFTANFGAPLARDIFDILFNEKDTQNDSEIRDLFINEENFRDSDYEKIYELIPKTKIDIFDNLLWEIFSKKIDFYAKNPQWREIKNKKEHSDMLHRLLVKICYSKNKSIFFTLNQDLFIERQLYKIFPEYSTEYVHIAAVLRNLLLEKSENKALRRLGVRDEDIINRQNLAIDDIKLDITDSNKDEAEHLYKKWVNGEDKNTYYVKLHGSMDFFNNQRPLLITGKNKGNRKNCTLIDYYWNIFNEVLANNECQLTIIGYGFNDEHINDALKNCLNSSHTKKIYIVTKQSKDKFLSSLKKSSVSEEKVLQYLNGFYSSGLTILTLESLIDVIP